MTLRNTKRREVSASRTHRTPPFLPCALWPRWQRKPGRSASSRTRPSPSWGKGTTPLPLSPDEAGAHLRPDGTRRAPPPAPCGAAGCQPDPAPAHAAAGRLEHDRARATRDLPGRAGCPAAGVHAAGLAPRPRRDGRRPPPPPPLPLPAAPYSGGAVPAASPTRQGGSMPPAPRPARPGPRR